MGQPVPSVNIMPLAHIENSSLRRRRAPVWACAGLLSASLACGDDDAPADSGVAADAGVTVDLGVASDAGETDLGAPDAGSRPDATAPLDAGYYCTMNGQAEVDGQPVPVPEATEAPTSGPSPSSLTCIDRQVQPFDNRRAVCFTQCADFFGFVPTPEQVRELEIAVFPAADLQGGRIDPSYDFVNRRERSPTEILGIGSRIVATQAPECTSGYQVEVGFLNLGSEMSTETEYVLRIRSRALTNPTWATTYVWDFIRRLDEANQIGAVCSNDETRIPERGTAFPIVPGAALSQAIQATSATINGADDLFDGQGLGYAYVETRDCSSTGSLSANMTVGFSPAPAAGAYVTESGSVDVAAQDTTTRGLFLALGLGSGTSSTGSEARTAVGVNRDGACTEGFGGQTFTVFPDSVTFIRTGRETTIQMR